MVEEGEELANERVPVTPKTLKRLKRWKIDYKTYNDVLNHVLDLAEKREENPSGIHISVDEGTYNRFRKLKDAENDMKRLIIIMDELELRRTFKFPTIEEIGDVVEEKIEGARR